MKAILVLLGFLLLAGFAPTAAVVLWADIVDKPATYAPSAHNHDDRYYTKSMSNRSFLASSYKPDWMSLINRPALFPAAPHDHNGLYYLKAQSDAAYLPSSYVPSWSSVTGKPATFAPSSHTHVTADVPGLATLLAGYVTTSDARLSDARTPVSHTHTAAQIVDFAQALTAGITSTSVGQGTLIRIGNVKVFCASGVTNASGECTINLTSDGTATGTPLFTKILANWSNATVATINLPNDVVTGCVRLESLQATTHRFIVGRVIVGTLLNSYANAPANTPVRITLIAI
jgi:hypothetical protein